MTKHAQYAGGVAYRVVGASRLRPWCLLAARCVFVRGEVESSTQTVGRRREIAAGGQAPAPQPITCHARLHLRNTTARRGSRET